MFAKVIAWIAIFEVGALMLVLPSHALFKRRSMGTQRSEMRIRTGGSFGWIAYSGKPANSNRSTEFNGNQYGGFAEIDTWFSWIGLQLEGSLRQAQVSKDIVSDFNGKPIFF